MRISVSGYDVGKELVFHEGQAIAQGELALLETLDLQLVARADGAQGVDRGVEVAMLLLQSLQFRFKRFAFGVGNFGRHEVRAIGADRNVQDIARTLPRSNGRRGSIAPLMPDGKGVATVSSDTRQFEARLRRKLQFTLNLIEHARRKGLRPVKPVSSSRVCD